MQHRMKTHPLSAEEIALLLDRATVATLASLNADGSPYTVPIHFVYSGGAIYFHGLPAGQKVENLQRDPRASFNVYHMDGLLYDPDGKPCDTNTKYQSVVVQGQVVFLSDPAEKETVLRSIIRKYTPHLAAKELPAPMVKGTAVAKLTMDAVTGKFYDE